MGQAPRCTVHFTTVTALCHLLSVRGDLLVSWTPVFYVFTPFNILARHVIAFLAILANYVYHSVKHRQGDSKGLKTSVSWLLGKAPGHDAAQYSQLPTVIPISSRKKSHTPLQMEETTKTLERILVIIFFLMQCCATIYLYTRRRHRGAVSLVDQKVFELACGGLLVGLLTMGLVSKVPVCSEPVPDSEKTGTDRLVVLCRDSLAVPFDAPPNKDLRLFQLVSNGVISFFILLISQKFDFAEGIRNFTSGRIFQSSLTEDVSAEGNILMIFGCTGIFGAFFYFFMRPLSSWADAARDERRGRKTRRRTIPLFRYTKENGLPCVACFCCPCAAGLAGMVMCTLFGFVPVIVIAVREYVRLFRQISASRLWSEDVACPMLWKDPISDWLPWLA